MSQPVMIESIRKNGLLLGAFALVCTALLSGVHYLTKPIIAEQQQLQKQKTLNEVLVAGSYDNQPALDCVKVSDPLLGEGEKIVYLARNQQNPVAAVIEAHAPDGYSGRIDILVAVSVANEVLGVRVVSHKETPGLGDKVETSKSDWILSFNGKTLTTDNQSQWAVKKDGGMYDAFTGATITPRAVVKAVKQTIEYYQRQQTQLFSAPNQCEVNP